MQLSHYFLLNAGLVDGVYCQDLFYLIFLRFWHLIPEEKRHAYCRNVKLCMKTFVVSFYKQNLTNIEIIFGNKCNKFGPKTDVHSGRVS